VPTREQCGDLTSLPIGLAYFRPWQIRSPTGSEARSMRVVEPDRSLWRSVGVDRGRANGARGGGAVIPWSSIAGGFRGRCYRHEQSWTDPLSTSRWR